MKVRVKAGWSSMLGFVGVITRPAPMENHVMVLFPDDPRECCFSLDELEEVAADVAA